jgi:hypothetical protein
MKNTTGKNKHIPNFSLHEPIGYQVKVAGEPGENWSEWLGQVDICRETDPSGMIVTKISGCFDQAAIHGLLRRLYFLGYPLISANYIQLHENNEFH